MNMNRPSFFHGVFVALVLALICTAVYFSLHAIADSRLVLKFLLTVSSCFYLVFLLRSGKVKVGMVAAITIWLLITVALWLLSFDLLTCMLVYTVYIWLVRSIYFYSSLFSSLLDFGLSMLSVAACLWAVYQSQSLFLGVWCFFLMQALFVLIPNSFKSQRSIFVAADSSDKFSSAYRNAESAIRRISIS